MKTYHISENELTTMREKINTVQTLLNVDCIAIASGLPPVPTEDRLDLAEEAEDIAHDVADILDSVMLRG